MYDLFHYIWKHLTQTFIKYFLVTMLNSLLLYFELAQKIYSLFLLSKVRLYSYYYF